MDPPPDAGRADRDRADGPLRPDRADAPLGPPHPDAEITLRLPTALRGGLLWRTKIAVTARTRIVDPELILGPGYTAGMQLNTIAPNATDEGSRGDSLVLTYPTLDEVAAEARLNQIGDLADVRYAVLETGGQISFVT